MTGNQHQTKNLLKNSQKNQLGFTVVELMVVFLIIVTLTSLLLVNWNKQSPNRSLKIVQNELVSNVKKIQSYAVSSRNISGGTEPAKFYVINFTEGAGEYSLLALDRDNNPTGTLETFKLPNGITITDLYLRSTVSGIDEEPTCAFVVFSVVYGKTYFVNGGRRCLTSTITSIIDNLPYLAPRSNFNLEISLRHPQNTTEQVNVIYGLNGKVGPKQLLNDGPGGAEDDGKDDGGTGDGGLFDLGGK